jgi:ATP-dependent DNA helicase DinG
MPSRLLSAFPAGVPVSRVPLDVAIARVEQRLTKPLLADATAELIV